MRFDTINQESSKLYRLGNFLTTSDRELKDIGKAWLAISLAFGLSLGGVNAKFFTAFLISGIAVGLGFLLHELSHKYVAQKYSYKAEFRSFDEMLFLAVIMGFFGFVLAAPGAVMIFSNFIDKKKNGIISVAGPIMNIMLALLCLLIAIILTGSFTSAQEVIHAPIKYTLANVGYSLLSIGFLINSWLALFNMIPFWMFDGAKVYHWNKIIYFLVLSISFIFVFLI